MDKKQTKILQEYLTKFCNKNNIDNLNIKLNFCIGNRITNMITTYNNKN